VRVSIPPHRYAIFEHRNHISVIQQTYAAIWDEWLPAHQLASADAPSIERHKETFDPRTGDGGVDIWIPIDG
jgi:AraC family transcriptional regulator